MVLAHGTSLPAHSGPQQEELRLSLLSHCHAAGQLPTAAGGEGSHHFTQEHIQQTFLHTLCHSTSWGQASQVQHQQHIHQQTSAHANSQFVPLLSTSAQGEHSHISETILGVFQGIAPNQTLAACPGSNSSRVKSCKFSHVRGSLVFVLPLMRTQADCDSSLSCAISTVVDYSKEVVLEQHLSHLADLF